MDRRLIAHLALLAAPLFWLSACSSSSFSKGEAAGLVKVDELLTRIEKVQVESLLAKERAHAAYDALQATVAPQFQGHAVEQYAALSKAIADSEKQAKVLAESIPQIKSAANTVFERWTKDLESFGNSRMRQRSQERMEATRMEYEAIVRAAVASQLSLEALNADLGDHALFLGHDFNTDSAAAIRDDVAALEPRVVELDGRLDAAIDAAKQYVAARALPGEVESAAPEGDGEGGAKLAKGQRRKARQQAQGGARAAEGGGY